MMKARRELSAIHDRDPGSGVQVTRHTVVIGRAPVNELKNFFKKREANIIIILVFINMYMFNIFIMSPHVLITQLQQLSTDGTISFHLYPHSLTLPT